MNNQKTPLEVRQYYEVSIAGLAKVSNQNPRQFREELKIFFVQQGYIKSSTKEFKQMQLEALAEIMMLETVKREKTPPEERGILDFNLIFND